MLLHIMRDDKFLDNAHELFERACPNRNRYVLITDDASRPLRYIKSFSPEVWTLKEFIASTKNRPLDTYAGVLLHSLDYGARRIVHSAPEETVFVWIGWGFDYYHLISDKLLLPETARLHRQLHKGDWRLYRASGEILNCVLREPTRSPRLIADKITARKFNSKFGRNARREPELLSKISWFAPNFFGEFELIRQRNPGFSPQFIPWNYGRWAEDAVAFVEKQTNSSGGEDILVGNSARFENNHLEAFKALQNAGIPKHAKVISPLSYGDHQYQRFIADEGTRLFDGNFIALTEFLPRSEYWSRVSNCSVVVMNHLRQQAMGNILFMLYHGASIVLNEMNPAYKELGDNGIDVIGMQNLASVFDSDNRPDACALQRRRVKLLNYRGTDTVRRNTEDLVSTLLQCNGTNPLPS